MLRGHGQGLRRTPVTAGAVKGVKWGEDFHGTVVRKQDWSWDGGGWERVCVCVLVCVCKLLCLLPPRAMEALAKALCGWVSHAGSHQAGSSPRAAGTAEQCRSPGALLQCLAPRHPTSAASQVPQQPPPSFLQA